MMNIHRTVFNYSFAPNSSHNIKKENENCTISIIKTEQKQVYVELETIIKNLIMYHIIIKCLFTSRSELKMSFTIQNMKMS